jgi:anti-sigma factor RsiW
MTCDDTRILLHALIDGELEAGEAREIEAHLADCPGCGAELHDLRVMHQALATPALRHQAPASLRRRLDEALPAPRRESSSRRSLLQGFGLGSVATAAVAASLALFAINAQQQQGLLDDVVSAHLRSLQGDHLIDVQSSDQHTVKPWFAGRLDLSPPVIDLAADGFALVGGRLDYIETRPVASIVYRHGGHVINLFVARATGADRAARLETLHGYHVWRWTRSGLDYWAVSDLNPDELKDFGGKLEAAVRGGTG